jgi:hypothetical protein
VIELAGRRIAIRHILYKGGKLTKDGRAFLDRLILTRQGITPKHILLDSRVAKVTPHGAMKSYLGCVSGGPADLSVKTGRKLRTLLRQPRGKS